MPNAHRPPPTAHRPTRLRRVAIDLVPIRVGEGGTGSGIWTYAFELLRHMDGLDFHGLEIVLLINKGQRRFLSKLQNFQILEVPVFGKNILFRVLWVHLFLPLLCLFRRIDVLHKLATETPLFCLTKRVTTVHDFYYEFLMEQRPSETIRLYERLENFYFSLTTRTCFRKSGAIISVSDATRQEAINRYPAATDRIHVIHHGGIGVGHQALGVKQDEIHEVGFLVDTFKCSTPNVQCRQPIASIQTPIAQRPEPSDSHPFNILCVAKFMEHKGQHLLIAAFETLLEQAPGWSERVHLNLRGFHNDEAYYDMIRSTVSASRFTKNIHLIPYRADEGMEEIYANTDLVVLLSSYEGFGLPVLEAQGMRIPVLCSDLPVLKEVGGTGAAYVSRDDRQAVADAMQHFVADPDYRETMRCRAVANTTRFSWITAAEKTLAIYAYVGR